MKIDPNATAHPEVATDAKYGNHGAYTDTYSYGGITIRTEIAARAMQGLLSAHPADCPFNPEQTAKSAIEHADALINALNAQP